MLRLVIVDVKTSEEIFFSDEINKTVVACSEVSWPDCNLNFTFLYKTYTRKL